MPTLATFNANNFFLRYKFAKTFEGDVSKKSEVEAGDVGSYGYIPTHVFSKAIEKTERSRNLPREAQRIDRPPPVRARG